MRNPRRSPRRVRVRAAARAAEARRPDAGTARRRSPAAAPARPRPTAAPARSTAAAAAAESERQSSAPGRSAPAQPSATACQRHRSGRPTAAPGPAPSNRRRCRMPIARITAQPSRWRSAKRRAARPIATAAISADSSATSDRNCSARSSVTRSSGRPLSSDLDAQAATEPRLRPGSRSPTPPRFACDQQPVGDPAGRLDQPGGFERRRAGSSRAVRSSRSWRRGRARA